MILLCSMTLSFTCMIPFIHYLALKGTAWFQEIYYNVTFSLYLLLKCFFLNVFYNTEHGNYQLKPVGCDFTHSAADLSRLISSRVCVQLHLICIFISRGVIPLLTCRGRHNPGMAAVPADDSGVSKMDFTALSLTWITQNARTVFIIHINLHTENTKCNFRSRGGRIKPFKATKERERREAEEANSSLVGCCCAMLAPLTTLRAKDDGSPPPPRVDVA